MMPHAPDGAVEEKQPVVDKRVQPSARFHADIGGVIDDKLAVRIDEEILQSAVH